MNKKLLAAHNKIVRLNGIVYRIVTSTLGRHVLADAWPHNGEARINLVTSRSPVCMAIRNAIDKKDCPNALWLFCQGLGLQPRAFLGGGNHGHLQGD
jgi:hypothetical protein